MSEDKKPEQNGPPSKPNQNQNQNHRPENPRGGHEGGRGGRFTRFGPRRDRDNRPPNDQSAGDHDGAMAEGNHDGPPHRGGLRGRGRGGRGGGPMRGDRDDAGRMHRGEDRIHDKLSTMSGNTYDLPPKNDAEQKFSSRCRLYVGNLAEITEEEVTEMFKKFGEINECFVNAEKMFAFVRLDYRANAERAKRELDGTMRKNRALKVRFAPVGAAIKVKNLTQWVTNELLEYAFSVFGEIERAQILVDDRGNSLKEGIVEFARKPTALLALRRCAEGCFFLTSSLRPAIVEPYDVIDDVDGFPEKSITRKPQEYIKSREVGPRFANQASFEYEYGTRWKQLYDLYKQKEEALKRELKAEEEKLEAQMEYARFEHETEMLREQLRKREMDRDRQKIEWELKERQADEQRRMDDDMMRRHTDDLSMRMHHQEDDMRRRQQENNMFIQAHQIKMEDRAGPNGNFEQGPGNAPGEQNMFMERNSRFEGGRKDEQYPRRWGHGGHPGHEDFPNKRRRY